MSRDALPGFLALRASLAFVWLAAAVASAADVGGRSSALLREAGLNDPRVAGLALWGGVAADALMGAWLLLRPGRTVYALAFAWTVAMGAIATLLVPGAWADPLGALAKNVPLLAALALLHRHAGA